MATAADLRQQLHTMLEAAPYRHLPWTIKQLFGGLPGGPDQDDPFEGSDEAFAPFMVQSDVAKHNETVTARVLRRIVEYDEFWAHTHGRVGAEVMRDQEESSQTAIKAIPNHFHRIGIRKTNTEQLLAWEGVDYVKQVNPAELAKLWAGVWWQGHLTTILTGYGPSNHRTAPTTYPYTQHPNTYYGYGGGFSFGETVDNLSDIAHGATGHMPDSTLPQRINILADELELPYLRFGGTQVRAACLLDRELYWRLVEKLDFKFAMQNADGPSDWFKQANRSFVWRNILFIEHGIRPFRALNWTLMTTTVVGGLYRILDTSAQAQATAAMAIDPGVGGPSSFSYAMLLGGGCERTNLGGNIRESSDKYADYELTDARWIGRVFGQARADFDPTDGTPVYNDSSAVILLRNTEGSF